MLVIPIKAVPNQSLSVQAGGQSCQVNVYQKLYGLFVDLYVGNKLVIAGVLAQNLRPMVLNAYLGLVGDLVFFDNLGTNDPYYTGLGTRFSLVYLAPSDLPASFKE